MTQFALGAIAAEKKAEADKNAPEQSELLKLKKEVQLHRWVILFLIIYIFFFKDEHKVRHTDSGSQPNSGQ